MVEPWWKRFPGRLRAELKALRCAEIEYKLDREKYAAGTLSLELQFLCRGESLSLTVEFPENYPYFEPIVFAPNSSFRIHQNPFQKNLCLLAHRTENWSTQCTLSDLLQNQIPKLIDTNKLDRDATRQLEIDQGEPLSTFYSTLPGSTILVDGTWKPDFSVSHGWLRIGLLQSSGIRIRGVVLRIEDSDHHAMASFDLRLAQPFQEEIWARWGRMDHFVMRNTPGEIETGVTDVHPHLKRPFWPRAGNRLLNYRRSSISRGSTATRNA